jgi:hypothetical protein
MFPTAFADRLRAGAGIRRRHNGLQRVFHHSNYPACATTPTQDSLRVRPNWNRQHDCFLARRGGLLASHKSPSLTGRDDLRHRAFRRTRRDRIRRCHATQEQRGLGASNQWVTATTRFRGVGESGLEGRSGHARRAWSRRRDRSFGSGRCSSRRALGGHRSGRDHVAQQPRDLLREGRGGPIRSHLRSRCEGVRVRRLSRRRCSGIGRRPDLRDAAIDQRERRLRADVRLRGNCRRQIVPPSRVLLTRWRGPESNRRHHGFQPCALPTELPRPGRGF